MAEVEEEEGKGGKKNLIIIIAGGLLLVGLSVGLTLFLLGGDEDSGSAESATQEAPAVPKGDPNYTEFKPPFTVNLAPEDPVGLLQVSMQSLTYFDEAAADIEANMPLIRNNLFTLFSEQQSANLRSREGKQELQRQVLKVIQDVVDEYGSARKVDAVFFTTFVMQ